MTKLILTPPPKAYMNKIMKQGSTICECGRDDIHSSKDCLTLEKLLDKWKDVLDYKPSEESEDEQKERLKNTVLIESEKFHPISQDVLDQIDKSVQNFKERKVFPINTSS